MTQFIEWLTTECDYGFVVSVREETAPADREHRLTRNRSVMATLQHRTFEVGWAMDQITYRSRREVLCVKKSFHNTLFYLLSCALEGRRTPHNVSVARV